MSYEMVIGLEVHVQLQTQSKLFAPDSATFGAAPNAHTSYITHGHPGTLPFLNEQAVAFAVQLGLALHCPIRLDNYFDRKNYFYPDLPKGYQISQDKKPICGRGFVPIKIKGEDGEDEVKKIRIHHIHLEEDAGKSLHNQSERYSMIDLNRAGVPLVEIVSEPDLRSAEETTLFLNEVRKVIQYLGISDGNMEEGSLRCDVNVSVRKKGAEKLGNRAEIKNMNSIRFVRKAIEFEFKRQIEILEAGGTVIQQTRGFDSEKGITLPQREKEMAHDYRYFPEPDLPALKLKEQDIEDIKQQLPAMPWVLLEKFTQEMQLSAYDAGLLTETRELANYFQEVVQQTSHKKEAANWILNSIKFHLKETQTEISSFPIKATNLAVLVDLVAEKKVNRQVATKQLFPAMMEHPSEHPMELAQKNSWLMAEDDGSAEDLATDLIQSILDRHPKEVKAYKNGKKNLIGMFMGELMRASKGKLDPVEGRKLLAEKLNNV